MNVTALITEWESKAAALNEEAARHRMNGMLTLAATTRTKRDQLNTCIEQLRATLNAEGRAA